MQFKISSSRENWKRDTQTIKIRVYRKVFSKQFCFLSDAEDNISGPLNRGGIADLPLLSTLLAIHQKSRERSFWEVMDYFVLLAYVGLAASRTLLQRLLACLNLTLDSEGLFSWYKRQKWILWTMATAQAAENHGDEWGLTWYFRWGIYTSVPTWSFTRYVISTIIV